MPAQALPPIRNCERQSPLICLALRTRDVLQKEKVLLPLVHCLLLSLVFVLNHASPDDFQPLSLREMHNELAANFEGAKVNIAGTSVIKQYYSASGVS